MTKPPSPPSLKNPSAPKGEGQQSGGGGGGRRRRGGRGNRRKDITPPEAADPAQIEWLKRTLAEAAFIVFDIETTGGNPEKNGITEIFALRWEGGEVKDTFYSLVNPGIPIPPIVRRMTGINNQMVRGAPKIEEVMPGFVEFIKNDILVSHNTIGDMKFIRHFGKVGAGVDIRNFFLCTHLLVEKLAPETPDKSLKGLAEYFKLASGELHRAEGDTYVTLELFKVLLGRLKAKNVKRLDEAVRLQGDFESGMRLGWGVSPSAVENLSKGPGVFYLHDHDGKLLFLSSAAQLDREIARLSSFQQLPRPLLKLVLRSYDVKTRETPDTFAALLTECDSLSREKITLSPTVWHQRTVQALYFADAGDEMRIGVGALESGTRQAFGPVRDRRLALELLEKLGEPFGGKVSRDVLTLNKDDARLVLAYFEGTLQQEHLELSKKARAFALWFKPKERKTLKAKADVVQRLVDVQNRLRLSPLLDRSGVLVIDDAGGGEPRSYPIVAARPRPSVKGSPATLAAKIKAELEAVKAAPVTDDDVHHVNATLWWLCNNRAEGKFLPLDELAP